MTNKLPETGMAVVMDLSKWSGPTKKYLNDLARIERAEKQSERVSKRATSGHDAMSNSISDLVGNAGELQDVTGSVTERFGGMQNMLGRLTNQLDFLPPQVQQITGGMGNLSNMLPGMSGSMSMLAGATMAVVGAFIALGRRGAAMTGVIEAFSLSAERAGVLADTLRSDLRAASRGTVSDMQLMTTANIALAGASQGTAEALGQGGLAGLMEVARAQARATGQDTNFLFDSLVTGVKRGSKQLIDNTGLVIDATAANEAYAQSLGIATDQLTDEQKQIALLNATLEAGQGAVESYGQGQLQASERMAQIQTSITNVLDKTAVAIQPIFNALLFTWQIAIENIVWPLENIVLPIFGELISTIWGPLMAAWQGMRSAAIDIVRPIWEQIRKWIGLAVGVIRLVGKGFHWLVENIGKALGPVKDFIKERLIEPFAKMISPEEFARRGGLIIGAFGEGLMRGANNWVFPVVNRIASVIASFLMGFSPPKEGPLSTIDKGGANVMKAWLDGFASAPLTPVEEVAANVNSELGKIGDLSHEQVEARLAQLDTALQPFVDQLDIANAKMNELLEPIKEAEEAVSKRLTRGMQQFTEGIISADQMRALDAQNQALYERRTAIEDMSAEAEYQLAMAKSQQTVERALLKIQLNRTQAAEEEEDATEKAAKTSASSAKTATGGAAEEEEEATAGGGGGFPTLGGDEVGDWLGWSDEELAELWGDVGDSFAEGFEMTGASEQFALMEQNAAELKGSLEDIAGSEPFQALTGAFEDTFVGDDSILQKVLDFKDDVTTAFKDLFDATSGVMNAVSLTALENLFTGVFTSDTGTLDSLVDGWVEAANAVWGDNGVMRNLFDGFDLDNLKQTFTNMFELSDGLRAPLSFFKNHIQNLFGLDGESTLSLSSIFGNFSLSNLVSTFEGVFGIESGTLKGLFDDWLGVARKVWGKEGIMWNLFHSIGNALEHLLVIPARSALNALIEGTEIGINAVIDALNGLIGNSVYGTLAGVWNDLPGTHDVPTGGTINQIDLAPIPGARSGGFLGPGLAKVHYGEMLMSTPSPMTVFPRRWVDAMDSLANTFSRQSYPVPPSRGSYAVPTPSAGNSGGMTINQNFQGPTDGTSVRRAWYQLRASGAV